MIDAWESIVAGQTDANSPLDQPLMDALRLRGDTLFDWLGKSYTPTDDHNHDNVNSKAVSLVGEVGQGQLKTASGSVSTATNTNTILPGGAYGFYPQFLNAGGSFTCQLASNKGASASYITNIWISVGSGGTVFARQRYVTATGTEHWLFLLVNSMTGEIDSAYEAPDHPMFGNGNDETLVPHPFSDYFDKGPETDGYEIVLVDIDDSNKIKNDQKNGDSRSVLEIIDDNYIADMSKTITFKPRDMDGKKTLQEPHNSYTVRKLKKK